VFLSCSTMQTYWKTAFDLGSLLNLLSVPGSKTASQSASALSWESRIALHSEIASATETEKLTVKMSDWGTDYTRFYEQSVAHSHKGNHRSRHCHGQCSQNSRQPAQSQPQEHDRPIHQKGCTTSLKMSWCTAPASTSAAQRHQLSTRSGQGVVVQT
jgi:hypothetical protein